MEGMAHPKSISDGNSWCRKGNGKTLELPLSTFSRREKINIGGSGTFHERRMIQGVPLQSFSDILLLSFESQILVYFFQ